MSSKTIFCLLSIALAAISPQSASAQNLREIAHEHARRGDGTPVEHVSSPGDYLPKTIDELTREADVVVRGRLVRGRSYFGPSEDRILTDYSIVEPRVIAGSMPMRSVSTPGVATPELTLTVFGGEVTVEGVLIRGTTLTLLRFRMVRNT